MKKSPSGSFFYERLNHLGNVQVVVSDKRISVCDEYLEVAYFKADVLAAMDYYPFGMMMPDRQWYAGSDSSISRFGFQGEEKDDEIKGPGNSVSFRYRIHDSRLGRFLSIDPLSNKFPANSPYAFSENRVIDCKELEGAETVSIHGDVRLSALITVSGVAGIMFDAQGMALFATGGFGGGFILSLSGGGGVSYSNVKTLEELSGPGYATGVGAWFIEVSADAVGDDFGNVQGATITFGPGWGGGAYTERTSTIQSGKVYWSDLANMINKQLPSNAQIDAKGAFNLFKTEALNKLASEIETLDSDIADVKSGIEALEARAKMEESNPNGNYWSNIEVADKFRQQANGEKVKLAELETQKKTLEGIKENVDKMELEEKPK